MSESANPIIGLYQVCGTMGNTIPGAPLLHFNLLVHPSTNSVTGVVHITQAVAPPNGNILVNNITGKIYASGFGPIKWLVSLKGTYGRALPPSEVIILEEFEAHMALDANWDGNGGFSYGGKHVENVPVKKGNC